jgi:hypothetical protein
MQALNDGTNSITRVVCGIFSLGMAGGATLAGVCARLAIVAFALGIAGCSSRASFPVISPIRLTVWGKQRHAIRHLLHAAVVIRRRDSELWIESRWRQ